LNKHVLDRAAQSISRIRIWIDLGASIQVAADLAGITESQLCRWERLAENHPSGPIAKLISELHQAETQAGTTYGFNGNGAHDSTTGNIAGGPNGQRAAQLLSKWDD
jgi:hypothetical protein